ALLSYPEDKRRVGQGFDAEARRHYLSIRFHCSGPGQEHNETHGDERMDDATAPPWWCWNEAGLTPHVHHDTTIRRMSLNITNTNSIRIIARPARRMYSRLRALKG